MTGSEDSSRRFWTKPAVHVIATGFNLIALIVSAVVGAWAWRQNTLSEASEAQMRSNAILISTLCRKNDEYEKRLDDLSGQLGSLRSDAVAIWNEPLNHRLVGIESALADTGREVKSLDGRASSVEAHLTELPMLREECESLTKKCDLLYKAVTGK